MHNICVGGKTSAQMGVYIRADSPFFWMLCERPGLPPLKISTKIPRDAADAMSRKLQRHQAEEIYRAQMNALARVRYELPADLQTITFRKFAHWFETHVLPRRRGNARELEILKRLTAHFGDADLTTISRDLVQEYITGRTGKVTASTINREVDVLKAVLREAVPKYLPASPLTGMKRLRVVSQKKGRTITPAEETRLLEQLQPADRAFYIVAVDALIRLSNVINLRWSEVRRGKLVLEDSKTGPYEVPLSTRAQAALKALLGERGAEKPTGAQKTTAGRSEYVFPHRRKAKQARDQRGAIRNMLKRACARCHPPIPYGRMAGGITWHTATRATGATRMLRKGADLRVVQGVGNWKDIRSVQTYLHSDKKAERNAVNLIGEDV